MNERKQDTRRKIQLGGLVVKAGLEDESPAVILGALLLARKSLTGPDADAARRKLQLTGDFAFSSPTEAP